MPKFVKDKSRQNVLKPKVVYDGNKDYTRISRVLSIFVSNY